MKSHVRIVAAAACAASVAGCSTLGLGNNDTVYGPVAASPAANPAGPAGDYPVVIGPAYTVNGVTYTPDDALNYDEVGYAVRDSEAGSGVTAAHHTLPLPSYIEVTELGEGRTALVRVERRGPMNGNQLLALSGDAMAQLGITSSAPVRVRRVNPPEIERAKLRAGERAPMRIATPSGLLTVLRRQMPETPTTASIRSVPIEEPAPATTTLEPAGAQEPTIDDPAPATTAPEPATSEEPKAPIATTGYYVQAGAYSERARADRVAARIDGEVYPAGRLWRVRSGPFASAAAANRDLARIRAAGFRDARVIRED